MSKNQLNIEELFSLIKEKIAAKENNSYTNKLAQSGLELIARKVGEEAVEVVVAAFAHEKNPCEKTRQELVGEVCDLYYHSLVLLASQGIELEEISKEFAKRNQKQ
jgi:phosphoribosyl-ATP pyrophosphohydrolase